MLDSGERISDCIRLFHRINFVVLTCRLCVCVDRVYVVFAQDCLGARSCTHVALARSVLYSQRWESKLLLLTCHLYDVRRFDYIVVGI